MSKVWFACSRDDIALLIDFNVYGSTRNRGRFKLFRIRVYRGVFSCSCKIQTLLVTRIVFTKREDTVLLLNVERSKGAITI